MTIVPDQPRQPENRPDGIDPIKWAQMISFGRNLISMINNGSQDIDLPSLYYIAIRTVAYEMFWDVDVPSTAFDLIQGAVDEAHKSYLYDEQNEDYEDAI